ncbi:hypothetical protein, partial [Microvirga roseola]|uniref:hypothetical protein n=1 Tax=Microvirga roseola TaxID=2883126 RepID=UPI001E4C6678
ILTLLSADNLTLRLHEVFNIFDIMSPADLLRSPLCRPIQAIVLLEDLPLTSVCVSLDPGHDEAGIACECGRRRPDLVACCRSGIHQTVDRNTTIQELRDALQTVLLHVDPASIAILPIRGPCDQPAIGEACNLGIYFVARPVLIDPQFLADAKN